VHSIRGWLALCVSLHPLQTSALQGLQFSCIPTFCHPDSPFFSLPWDWMSSFHPPFVLTHSFFGHRESPYWLQPNHLHYFRRHLALILFQAFRVFRTIFPLPQQLPLIFVFWFLEISSKIESFLLKTYSGFEVNNSNSALLFLCKCKENTWIHAPKVLHCVVFVWLLYQWRDWLHGNT
jgi:hypothetical protein